MIETIVKREDRDADGTARLVEIRNLACETCGAFVRAEAIAPPPRS